MKIRHLNAGDFISGCLFAILGLFVVSEARNWDYIGAAGPGPGFFPVWYGGFMIVLAVVLVARSCIGRTATAAGVRWNNAWKPLAALGGFFLCVGFMDLAGFPIAFCAFVFFLVFAMFRQRFSVALLTAVAMSLAMYVLFHAILGVRLPVGLLGF